MKKSMGCKIFLISLCMTSFGSLNRTAAVKMSIKDEVIQKMEKLGAKHLLLQFTGADGHLKGVEISKNAFTKSDSIGIDGSSIG
ncbi:MAG: hypothetical protein ACFFD4_37200, partial [Candidatus Odinarchaeota archaeon]